MTLAVTMLFERPQREVASLIADRISRCVRASIVTGFATPGGLAAISSPIRSRPSCLQTLVIGAATYPAFNALDELVSAGVPIRNLYVHLGHAFETGGKRNPFTRYHPMMHSKIYFMEHEDGTATAFVGSHNLTAFALAGLNGEAAVMLEGPSSSAQFDEVRQHISMAQSQSMPYSPELKEAYAWWAREFLDGLKAEMGIPQDWQVARTILVFAEAASGDRPRVDETVYFEIPDGIEQIESFRTEVHIFLFDVLPPDPQTALLNTSLASAQYTCTTLGVENRQGNLEVAASWRIDGRARPVLRRVSSGSFRPGTLPGWQQVRAGVATNTVDPREYLFERERGGWDPEYGPDEITNSADIKKFDEPVLREGRPGRLLSQQWKLVRGLKDRSGPAGEKDHAALRLAAPESGAFILVSLRSRRRDKVQQEGEF